MKLQEMMELKSEKGYSCAWIAEQTGIPVSTVRKIFGGETKQPRRETMQALEELFAGATVDRSRDKYRSSDVFSGYTSAYQMADTDGDGEFGAHLYERASESLMVSEPMYRYGSSAQDVERRRKVKPQKLPLYEKDNALEQNRLYTIDDYYRMPDSPRVELLDGRLFVMTAPTLTHQSISISLIRQICDFIDKSDHKCTPFIAPVDVQLDEKDDTTIVQPDVLIVCDENKLADDRRIIGAPDFIIEIISPTNRKHDTVRKKKKYEQAGVREYWMVDPDDQTIITTTFEDSNLFSIHPFSEPVSVAISDGKLVIDLSSFCDGDV